MVGDTHRHPEIEADSARLLRRRKTRHSADILRYRDCIMVEFVDKPVRQAEVGHCVFIHSGAEIHIVTAEVGAQAVVPVKHGGHPVEAESVQMVLFHPVFAVGEQEELHLVLAVIETTGTPCRMMSGIALIKIEVFPAVETAQAFRLVGNGMGMDNVHDDGDTFSVGLVYKALELLRSAEARTEGEEIADLIPEGTVVRMFL